MAALCSIITLFVVVGVAFLVYSGLAGIVAVLVPGRMRRKVTTFLAILALFPFFIIGFYWWQSRPGVVFENTFGLSPPVDVKNIQSEFAVLGDSGHCYLAFDASPQTIARLSSLMTRNDNALWTANAIPSWWQPSQSLPTVHRWESSAVRKGFSNEHAQLIYDTTASRAWYAWEGID